MITCLSKVILDTYFPSKLVFQVLVILFYQFYQYYLSNFPEIHVTLKLSSCMLWCMHAKSLKLCWLFASLWTVAHWSRLQCPPPGCLPDPQIKHTFLMSPAFADVFFTTTTPELCNFGLKTYRVCAPLLSLKHYFLNIMIAFEIIISLFIHIPYFELLRATPFKFD